MRNTSVKTRRSIQLRQPSLKSGLAAAAGLELSPIAIDQYQPDDAGKQPPAQRPDRPKKQNIQRCHRTHEANLQLFIVQCNIYLCIAQMRDAACYLRLWSSIRYHLCYLNRTTPDVRAPGDPRHVRARNRADLRRRPFGLALLADRRRRA